MTQPYPGPNGWQNPQQQAPAPQWAPLGAVPPQVGPPIHIPPKKKGRGKLGALVLLAFGLVAACTLANAGGTPAAKTPTAPTWNSAAPAAAAPAAAAAAPSGGPVTSVSEGTYEVGTGDGQVAPGKYKSPGPTTGSSCYYARLSSDQTTDIIANDLKKGPTLMTVKASDKYIEVNGCTFTKA